MARYVILFKVFFQFTAPKPLGSLKTIIFLLPLHTTCIFLPLPSISWYVLTFLLCAYNLLTLRYYAS